MAEALLERLSKKKIPKKNKPVQINIKGTVAVSTQLIDKTDEDYNADSFIQKLKERNLKPPKLFQSVKEPEKKQEDVTIIDRDDTVSTPPKKITKKIKLPGEKKTRKKRQPTVVEDVTLDIPATLVQIDERPIGERLKAKEPSINIKAPSYYFTNREFFINFINSTFKPYTQALKIESGNVTCDTQKSDGFKLMIHQKIIRDYLNLYTPYRGLLVYHGLGAGKTCGSIAIAEGMKEDKQIIIMTPASLRMNYISELKFCGDFIYKKNQFWEKIYTNDNPIIEKALSEILDLNIPYIRKQGFVWMVDVKKSSNFESLEPDDQKSIDKQINQMIIKKYKFISYNGMRDHHLSDMIEESREKDGTDNPFDNKVIIIDEAHNFVSRIVNKLEKNKSGLSTNLYELILSANNCKVVFLTGTPMINYPNEIGILYNMLRGYIKTFYIKLDLTKISSKVNQNKIKEILKKNKLLDYIEYKSSSKTLIVTRNPFGFVTRQKSDKTYAGISNNKRGLRDDNYFIGIIKKALKVENIGFMPRGIDIITHKALPDKLETFKNLFIDPITGEMKESNIFKKRILGLTSYFRSASEALLPRYTESKNTHIIKIPMSNYQIGVYEVARAAERKEEKRNAKKKKKQMAKKGIYADTTSTYRIFSRAFCNFVFPNELDETTETLISRPLPNEEDTLESSVKKNTKINNESKEKKSSDVVTSNLDEDVLDGSNVKDKINNIDGLYDMDDIREIEETTNEVIDSSYATRIKQALTLLKKNKDKYLVKDKLKTYSPKFLEVLKNLTNPDHVGLHLIYSQFRTLEGVGILSIILESNGFARFTINKNSSGVWDIDVDDEDIGKPTFALYTGTESAEEKEIIRNIFNGSWDSVPSTLAAKLRSMNDNNNMGEIIKILMITSSGSEGITLQNTRFVHIIEPYWHPVRTDQVIGRARRICSHKNLAEEFRTVDVFVYLMTFTEKQLNGDPSAEIESERAPVVSVELKNSKADKSKIDKTTSFTSDETLYEISSIKKTTSDSILKAIKEAAIDCQIHSQSNQKEGLVCYSFGNPSVTTFSSKPDYSKEEKDSVSKQNVKTKIWKAYPIKLEGIKYAIKRTDSSNKKIGEIYDLDSYMLAKKNKTAPELVGRTQVNPTNPKDIQFIKITDPNF
jgi:hypothetical protein